MPSQTIVLCGGGTRGDQQPVAMIGAEFKKLGYHVVFCVGSEAKGWADAFDFEYIELQNFQETVNTDAFKNCAETGNFYQLIERMSIECAKNCESECKLIYERCKQPDVVGFVCTSMHFPYAEIFARKPEFNMESVMLFFTSMIPTTKFPPMIIDKRNPQTWKQIPNPVDPTLPGPFADCEEYPEAANFMLWEGMVTHLFGSFYDAVQLHSTLCEASENHPETKDEFTSQFVRNWKGEDVPELKSDILFAVDDVAYKPLFEELSDVQKDFFTGYCFDLGGSSLTTFPKEVEDFLSAREDKPLYFGWGSMSREHNDQLVRAAIGTAIDTKKRAFILKGWAGLSLDMLDQEGDKELIDYANAGNILFLDGTNFDKLFPQCEVIVCHGGAGTTAITLRSGTPAIITPVWWDMVFFGDRLEDMNVGLRGPHFSELTRENLGEWMKRVLESEEMKRNAQAIRKELLERPLGQERFAKRMHEKIQQRLTQKASE